MSIQVKICGLSTLPALDAAINCHADFSGFVFFPRSPRNVTLEQAASLSKHAQGKIKTVALVVDAGDQELRLIADAVAPDYFQLHGDETVERVSQIKALTGKRIIKAIKVRNADDIEKSRSFEQLAEMILFDAFATPSSDALPGGNGLSFDWTLLRGPNVRRDFMLSGGLNAANVAAAINESGARAVDVSSGVESAPGIKDADRIASFIAAAKLAAEEKLIILPKPNASR